MEGEEVQKGGANGCHPAQSIIEQSMNPIPWTPLAPVSVVREIYPFLDETGYKWTQVYLSSSGRRRTVGHTESLCFPAMSIDEVQGRKLKIRHPHQNQAWNR